MNDTLATVLDSLDLIIFLVLIGVGYFIGRRNERRHLADLARRERELRDVTIYATRYPPVHATVHDPMLVSGSAVVAADAFKMFVAGLRKIFGGRFHAYETLIDRARREALLRMKAQARAAGCPMIFNVRIDTTQLMAGNRGGSTAVEVFAYGTAFAPAAGTIEESLHTYTPGPALPEKEGFDLMKSRTTKWLLIGWFASLIYALTEMTFADYWYVEGAPWSVFWILAAFAFAGLFRLLRRRQVPRAESIGVGLVLAATLPFVIFFPALRINALTDFSSATPQIYVLQPDGRLTAPTPGFPELGFPEHGDYWRAQETGSGHEFVVRRGWLGFWQVAREPYISKLRAFNEAKWAAERAERAARQTAPEPASPVEPAPPAPAPADGAPPP